MTVATLTVVRDLRPGDRPEVSAIYETNVFPENRASVSLHRACGFRIVGLRERIGKLDAAWRDVFLERRSEGAGR